MQGRARLLIIVAFVVILGGVVIAFSGVLNPPAQPVATPADGTAATARPAAQENLPPTATEWPIVQVVTAAQNLNRGFKIPEAEGDSPSIQLFGWPEGSVPENAIVVEAPDNDGVYRIPDFVRGSILRTDVARGQMILDSMLVQDLTDVAAVGSDAAAVLPRDFVAVSVPMDRITSVAYAIQDGDYVDVIVSLLFVEIDLDFQALQPNAYSFVTQNADGQLDFSAPINGRFDTFPGLPGGNATVLVSPSEAQRPRLVTQRTIQDAIVVHVGDFPSNGRLFNVVIPSPTPLETPESGTRGTAVPATPIPPRPDIITLGVPPQDAVSLVWFIEAKLPLTFALRSTTRTSRQLTTPVTLDYVLQAYNISVPGKTDYSIQPAIRSIRQLISGNEISLNG